MPALRITVTPEKLSVGGSLFCEPANPSRKLRAASPEPRALGALKDSCQKIQKWGQCPNMVFITCEVYHVRKMKSNESGLTKSDWTLTSFFFLFQISYMSEEKYGNNEPVCQKWNSQQSLVDQNNWTISRADPEYSGQKKLT